MMNPGVSTNRNSPSIFIVPIVISLQWAHVQTVGKLNILFAVIVIAPLQFLFDSRPIRWMDGVRSPTFSDLFVVGFSQISSITKMVSSNVFGSTAGLFVDTVINNKFKHEFSGHKLT
jgi:hypothetical protein